jgi:hypothetical protein
MQEKVTGVPQCGGLQFTDVGSSVDDLTYDSKMVRNINRDNTTQDGRYTIGRGDCSVGDPVIHPDYDMGGGDMDDIIPTHQSRRSYTTTPIVDLTDEFSNLQKITTLILMNLSIQFLRRRTCNFFGMQDTNHCVTMTTGS